jgi:aminoglycoside phosphotransferase (APT) family kinase protein
MTNVWDAERVVDFDEARKLVRTQFPEIRADRLDLLGIGWDNTAYLVDGMYVFRFPRREIAVPLLRTESGALRHLAKHLPVTVPNPRFFAEPTADYQWPFAGYELLPGETACRANLSVDERMQLVEPLARFLKALHAVAPEDARRWGLRDDPLQKCDPEKRLPQLQERIEQIARLKLYQNIEKLFTILKDCSALRAPPATTTVHGDLYARHLLIDEQRCFAGVIDWGDVHIGSPATDLSIVHNFLPQQAHDPFLQSYGPVNEEDWNLARMRAAFLATVLLLYGHDTSDEALIREAITALNFMTEAQAG